MQTFKRAVLTTATVALSLALVVGCSKKAPKNAKEAGQDNTQQMHHAAPMGGVVANPDGSVLIGPLQSNLPESWKPVTPASSMRIGQFQIAPVDGDTTAGELTVFYFGPKAGTVDMNIDRWIGQFTQADGKPLADDMVTRKNFDVNGLKVTMVQFKGTQAPSAMPGAPSTPAHKNWMNISGIVMTPEGPWFFKGSGPEKTMEKNEPAFENFFQAMRYVGHPGK